MFITLALMVDFISYGAMQFSTHFWLHRDSQLLSSALMANILICSQLEKRNMILMLWQPEQSWRQLEQVAGDSKDFFPDNNSKPKLLSFNKKQNKKKQSTPHPLSRKTNYFWLTLKMGKRTRLILIITQRKVLRGLLMPKDVYERNCTRQLLKSITCF